MNATITTVTAVSASVVLTAAEIALLFASGRAPKKGFRVACVEPGQTMRISRASFQKTASGKNRAFVNLEYFTDGRKQKAEVCNTDEAFTIFA